MKKLIIVRFIFVLICTICILTSLYLIHVKEATILSGFNIIICVVYTVIDVQEIKKL